MNYDLNTGMDRFIQLAKESEKGRATEIFMQSVDWSLLKKQYENLSDNLAIMTTIQAAYEDEELAKIAQAEVNLTKGLIHLLEGLKDLAVDHFGVDKETVFDTPL